MTRRERIAAILATHDQAVKEMAQARADGRAAHRHMVAALTELQTWAEENASAVAAQDRALEQMMAANRAALRLLDEEGPA